MVKRGGKGRLYAVSEIFKKNCFLTIVHISLLSYKTTVEFDCDILLFRLMWEGDGNGKGKGDGTGRGRGRGRERKRRDEAEGQGEGDGERVERVERERGDTDRGRRIGI